MHDEGSSLGEWRPDARLLDGLSMAAIAVDHAGRVVYANPTARSRFGSGVEEAGGGKALAMLFPTAALYAEEVLHLVLTGGSWTGEMQMRGLNAETTSASTSWSPIYQGGHPQGALLLVEEARSTVSHANRLTRRLQRLAGVTSELLVADGIEAVTDIVLHHMADAAGATVSSLSLLVDVETLALVGIRGGRDGVASRWATYPVRSSTPAGDALRSGRPLVVIGAEEFKQRYPEMEMATDGERSLVCLPLLAAARPVGAVSLSSPGRRVFDVAELEFLGVLADACAQALDRIRALAEAEDRELKLRFLAAASAELASSLDYESTLSVVAHLAVPQFADWCVIELLDDGVLRPLAIAHPDSWLESRILELQKRYPSDPESKRGAYEVVRTGRSELVPEISDDMLVAAAIDETHLQVLRDLQFRSALQVPLQVRGRVFGVITWVAGEDGRRFSAEDLAFGEDLARRAAVAIDNSQLHSQIRDVAVRLQQAVLPASLPRIEGWEVAARYRPAGRTEVGGDFYDVVPLADGRLVSFVGDVMGRGVAAASAMAQMRSALRTLIALDPDPRAVMSGLDALFAQYDLDRVVTVVYALADPLAGSVQVINAGHPRPIMIEGAGRTDDIVCGRSLILGAGGADREVVTRPFVVGDTLLMFSDGLIERRHEDLERGQQRVRDATHLLGAPNLVQGLADLVEAVRDQTRDDDVAAVAIRRSQAR
jgi:serine phosphatase RsbU (regulator of sigma subunit)